MFIFSVQIRHISHISRLGVISGHCFDLKGAHVKKKFGITGLNHSHAPRGSQRDGPRGGWSKGQR